MSESAPLPLAGPGPSLCVLRLSSIGDVVQVVPAVRALQERWPEAHVTWVMGSIEARLAGDLDGVEVVVLPKGAGWRGLRGVGKRIRRSRFDVLLHMHASFRANLVSGLISAPVRVGFDPARSRDLHGLFVNRRLPPDPGAHVLEGFFSFARLLGAGNGTLRWDIPVSTEDEEFARTHLPDDARWLVISPASSRPRRNWSARRYARVAAHAASRHGMRIALCGGPSARERRIASEIESELGRPVTNLVGRDTLKKLLAVLRRATVLLAPDSGPAHMASAVGTPVVGLYAATDPARSGPYRSLRWCVDRFDAAARRFRGCRASELPWGTKLGYPGVMDLIEVEAVVERMDALVAAIEGGEEPLAPPRIAPRRKEAQPSGPSGLPVDSPEPA